MLLEKKELQIRSHIPLLATVFAINSCNTFNIFMSLTTADEFQCYSAEGSGTYISMWILSGEYFVCSSQN